MITKKQSVDVNDENRLFRVDHDNVIFRKNDDGVDTPADLADDEKDRIIASAEEKRARGQKKS
jgi:hypothetical protein